MGSKCNKIQENCSGMEDHFDISDAFEISKFEIRGCTCIKIYEFLFSNPLVD